MAIRVQYFLTFAVIGCVLPYLPVYLAWRQFDDRHIGYVTSMGGVATLLTPVLLSLLADLRVESRILIGTAFALAAAALGGLWLAETFAAIFVIHLIFALVLAPLPSLQDGLTFNLQQLRTARGQQIWPYHRIRVFGSIGFMAPPLGIYWLLNIGHPVRIVMVAGVMCAVFGFLNATKLPRLLDNGSPARPPRAHEVDGPKRLPTLSAARTILESHMAVFCIAMFILHLAISAYYTFYPIYLTRQLGIDAKWIGLIMSIGVAIEIFFILAWGSLVRRLGLRGLMVLGVTCTAVRFALLYFVPTTGMAIGTQVLHGAMVLVVHVAPPIYLNHRAGDTYRNSIQGLYAMAITGPGRIIGTAIAGHIVSWSLPGVFGYAAALCTVATILLYFAFREPNMG